MDQVGYTLDIENSFVYFMVALHKLHLSKQIIAMMSRSDMSVAGFVPRNWRYVRKPAGILVL